MLLLVSPADVPEALAASVGGADIIDVKNPAEGSLGANFPWVIETIKNALPPETEISATIGDLEGKPGLASQAAYGVSRLEVDYIKAGLFVSKTGDAEKLARAIVKAGKGSGSKVVLAGYADHNQTGKISPTILPDIAERCGADGVMIDTYSKNGQTLFEHMKTEELKQFLDVSREKGLITALAGSIQKNHLPKLKKLAPHIIGVRGAVCTGGERLKGKIEKQKVEEFKRELRKQGRVV